MDESVFPEELKPLIAFHGHYCPGILTGWRASKLAMKLLGATRDRDEEMVAIVENDACGADAIQFVLGCTFGKGNFHFRDYGKHVFTVFRRSDGKGVRLSLKAPPEGLTREESARRMIEERDENLFTVGEPLEPIPDMAEIRNSIVCSRCGERVMETRAKMARDGSPVCIPCSAAE
ncbi:MAG: formylmethanofuran dehydrogenase [Synergistaceae bacterium]|nr:formylmethanofuran dehydrogenase [Synergistaceae bacterium]